MGYGDDVRFPGVASGFQVERVRRILHGKDVETVSGESEFQSMVAAAGSRHLVCRCRVCDMAHQGQVRVFKGRGQCVQGTLAGGAFVSEDEA